MHLSNVTIFSIRDLVKDQSLLKSNLQIYIDTYILLVHSVTLCFINTILLSVYIYCYTYWKVGDYFVKMDTFNRHFDGLEQAFGTPHDDKVLWCQNLMILEIDHSNLYLTTLRLKTAFHARSRILPYRIWPTPIAGSSCRQDSSYFETTGTYSFFKWKISKCSI